MINAADTLAGGADSLRRSVEALFLAGAQFGPLPAADSVRTAPPATTAADLYGAGSVLCTYPAAGSGSLPLTSHPLFQLLVLLLAAVYTLLLYRHWADVRLLFARTTFESATAARTVEGRGSSNHARFQRIAIVLGLLLAGTLAVKGADIGLPPGTGPAPTAVGLSLLTAAALAGVFLFSAGLLRLAGAVTLTQETTAALAALKRSAIALSVVAAGPFVLFYTLSPAGMDQVWLYIVIAETVIVAGCFLMSSLGLFLRKKISILHWFLYLCSVELFPLSLLWLLATRR